jgi:hypothetical protein
MPTSMTRTRPILKRREAGALARPGGQGGHPGPHHCPLPGQARAHRGVLPQRDTGRLGPRLRAAEVGAGRFRGEESVYHVNVDGQHSTCDCRGFERWRSCKHLATLLELVEEGKL